ncbi:dTDP-4-dehydrorhamnose 3,5-epimerase family protein [Frankia sp. AgPm24]|uniref:dTDP-4-dehydrorhamnose 3,5-epimerase family protein n=1 Tax=Frankia umida TaxID=573489 RepID=A0ABT0K0A1_9ACTN|nr:MULTISPECIES: dTDP-4-dehydrorhamnose 3,5-epimerase family protein [Frankia]MCK9877226.1 dTDP-4-dehydrorhamnose 3,5-epimerase family protein [Frankia umida]MCK9923526.1 dTDP-4-dehydrorhamnose 3,5-epimerase family protein [Frankia sp. AgPm24]
MIVTPTAIDGVWIVDVEPFTDARGMFARTFCAREFAAAGLTVEVAQASVAYNATAGTIRGLHWAHEPVRETKLVRVTRGALLDVVVDVRPDSPTHLRHVAVELSADNHRALFIAAGLAHGYQTLVDATEATYQMNVPFTPGHDRGLRFDDPRLAIAWPLPVSVISDKDRAWSLLPDGPIGGLAAAPAEPVGARTAP